MTLNRRPRSSAAASSRSSWPPPVPAPRTRRSRARTARSPSTAIATRPASSSTSSRCARTAAVRSTSRQPGDGPAAELVARRAQDRVRQRPRRRLRDLRDERRRLAADAGHVQRRRRLRSRPGLRTAGTWRSWRSRRQRRGLPMRADGSHQRNLTRDAAGDSSRTGLRTAPDRLPERPLPLELRGLHDEGRRIAPSAAHRRAPASTASRTGRPTASYRLRQRARRQCGDLPDAGRRERARHA